MALQTAQVNVGTSPVELTSQTPSTDNIAGMSIVVQAPATATLYVGGPAVTVATGFPVAAGQTITGDIEGGERLYGVLATGTATAYVLQSGI